MKIRDYIIDNFKDDDIHTLRDAINECLKEDDEETLPGLGVFLELIWEKSDETLKKSLIKALHDKLKDFK